MQHQRSTRTALTLAVALMGVAACGGGSDSAELGATTDDVSAATSTPVTEATDPPDTDPPDTDPPDTEAPATDPATTEPVTTAPLDTDPPSTDAPPSTEFVLGADTVSQPFAGGFLTMDIWPGWEAESEPTTEPATYIAEINEPAWTLDPNSFDTMASYTSGNAGLTVFREPQYGAVSYEDWRAALITVFSASNPETPWEVLSDESTSWAGVEGDIVSFDTGDGPQVPITVLTADVDGQYVGALYSLGDMPDVGENTDQIDAMLETIEFDPSVVGPLAHSVDVEFRTTAAGPEFSAAVLVPFDWQMDAGSDSLAYRDPLTGANVSITIVPSQGGLDTSVALAESLEFLDNPATRVDDEANGLAYAVLWDGPERDANQALIVADDGVYGAFILVEQAVALIGGEEYGNRLIDWIVSSTWFDVHSG